MRSRAALMASAFVMVVVLGVVTPVMGGTYNWTFQEAGYAGGPSAGLAMRTNGTWPVAFGQSQSYGNMTTAYSLKPVGWVQTPLGMGPGGYGIKAEAAPSGQVAAVWSTGYNVEFAAASGNGWLRSSFMRNSYNDTPDLAFLSNSNPVVAYSENDRMTLMSYSGSAWNRVQIQELRDASSGQYINPAARRVSVAADSQDNVCLAYAYGNQVGFAYQDFMSGSWYGKYLTNSPNWPQVSDVSLAFGLSDQVGLAFRTDDRQLFYSSFDPRTGNWTVNQVASNVDSQRVNLVFDQLGNPAMSYVSQGSVKFAIKVGYGWANYALPTQSPYMPYGNTDAALAFDSDNLPVIAYNSSQGKMILAYDPIVVPEPASILMLAGGLLLAGRRWKAV